MRVSETDTALIARLKKHVLERDRQGLLRQHSIFHAASRSAHTQSFSLTNFAGNDYLGLAHDPDVITAWQNGLKKYGAGSGGSPLVTGYQQAHHNFCAQLSEWLGYDKALLFNSGFSANQAVLLALLGPQDVLYQDKYNHASLIEAGMLSSSRMQRFKHNAMAHLSFLMKKNEQNQTNYSGYSVSFVVTEGVFSMDGDLAPLPEISAICREKQATLLVDDAHGIGILGEHGKGACDHWQVTPDILIVTFGKAFGVMGAAVLCNHTVYEYLTQFSRHYIYSTAMPPAQAMALSCALNLIQTQDWRRDKLQELSSIFHHGLQDCPQVIRTITPIKPVILPDLSALRTVSDALNNFGFKVGAIRPPTVPSNAPRLRITLTAAQSLEKVKSLVRVLNPLLHQYAV